MGREWRAKLTASEIYKEPHGMQFSLYLTLTYDFEGFSREQKQHSSTREYHLGFYTSEHPGKNIE